MIGLTLDKDYSLSSFGEGIKSPLNPSCTLIFFLNKNINLCIFLKIYATFPSLLDSLPAPPTPSGKDVSDYPVGKGEARVSLLASLVSEQEAVVTEKWRDFFKILLLYGGVHLLHFVFPLAGQASNDWSFAHFVVSHLNQFPVANGAKNLYI